MTKKEILKMWEKYHKTIDFYMKVYYNKRKYTDNYSPKQKLFDRVIRRTPRPVARIGITQITICAASVITEYRTRRNGE